MITGHPSGDDDRLCTSEQFTGACGATLRVENHTNMSASHHPTDVHLRQHRRKKRAKLRALIAAKPKTGLAAIEAKVQRTYSLFHVRPEEKPPVAAV